MPPKRQSPTAGSPSIETAIVSSGSPLTAPAIFQNSAKKPKTTSTRTGQACDRCKTRKIRCDAVPGGCSPCTQNRTECKTTDRITGRATSRGHVSYLERRAQEQEERIRELEDRLVSMGADVKYTIDSATTLHERSQDWSHDAAGGLEWNNLNRHEDLVIGFSASQGRESNVLELPEFRAGLSGDNYLGVSSGNALVSSIRGTSLGVFGMEIDLANFKSDDLDDPDPLSNIAPKTLYNKSYQSFVHTAFGTTPKVSSVGLPPREDGIPYAQLYLKLVNTYLPVLHSPTTTALIGRIYDDPIYKPSAAECVMVHMIFASIFFQYAARNWKNPQQQSELTAKSNLHYHYSLGLLPQLMASHTLQDVQALTLISMHIRNFPKPGAACTIINMAFNLAIELGLHRSAQMWPSAVPGKSPLELEMRKRIFWSIMIMHVTISGKLGRPMPLRLDDLDIELPESIDDESFGDPKAGTSKPSQCAFRVGLELLKMAPLYLELFGSIYAIKRSPRKYIESVRRLDHRIGQWSDQLPSEWKNPFTKDWPAVEREEHVRALMVNMYLAEIQLLLHHPSLSLTSSVEFNNKNLDICMEVSHTMLLIVELLQQYVCLDTTWLNGAIFVLAISTTLFGHWERKDTATAASLNRLRESMNSWLSILGDVGALLGSGNSLRDTVRVTVDNTIGLLEGILTARTAPSDGLARSRDVTDPHRVDSLEPRRDSSGHNAFPVPTGYAPYSVPHNTPVGNVEPAVRGGYIASDHQSVAGQGQPPHQHTAQYSYSEPSASALPFYGSNQPYEPRAYPVAVAAEALAKASPRHPNTPAATAYMYPNPTTVNTPYPGHDAATEGYGNHNVDGAGSQSWRQWAGTINSNAEPHGYLDPAANALMQLGARNDQGSTATAPQEPLTVPMSGGEGPQWPLVMDPY